METIAAAIPSGKFALRQTFFVGGEEKGTTDNYEVCGLAKSLINHPSFVTHGAEDVRTITLSPSDLGFNRRMPTTKELFDPAMLVEWSRANEKHLNGSLIDLPPGAAGPIFRSRYENQPPGETLWMAVKQVVSFSHGLWVFIISRGRDSDGKLRLNAICASPDARWNLNFRFIFRLKPQNLSS